MRIPTSPPGSACQPGNTTSDVSLTDFREKYIADITSTLEDEEFVKRHRADKRGKGFTRKRKLPFIYLIILITQGLSRSIQRELNSFYQKLQGGDFSIQEVTKGAFTHARSKLDPEAFVELNRVGLESFYRDAPYLKWQGFRLLAIDGSTMVLPKHPSIIQEFGTRGFGPNADSQRSIARISLLYDVLNLTTLDGQMGQYDTSERELARRHFSQAAPGKDLIILDRGYPSISLMFELQQQGIDYCIRMQQDWWVEVHSMVKAGETDKIVHFKLSKKDRELLHIYKTSQDEIMCRLVIVTLPDGSSEVLCTSVTNKERLPYEVFATLYNFRWNIEEAYKLFKCRIQLEAFSGKTTYAIKQDFFAKVFMMTTTAVMAFPVEEKLKKEQEQTDLKHPYKVNRTNALSLIREMTAGFFLKRIIRPAIKAFDSILEATKEIVRPGRKVPRKKSAKKPPSMNYKQL